MVFKGGVVANAVIRYGFPMIGRTRGAPALVEDERRVPPGNQAGGTTVLMMPQQAGKSHGSIYYHSHSKFQFNTHRVCRKCGQKIKWCWRQQKSSHIHFRGFERKKTGSEKLRNNRRHNCRRPCTRWQYGTQCQDLKNNWNERKMLYRAPRAANIHNTWFPYHARHNTGN